MFFSKLIFRLRFTQQKFEIKKFPRYTYYCYDLPTPTPLFVKNKEFNCFSKFTAVFITTNNFFPQSYLIYNEESTLNNSCQKMNTNF